MNRKATITLLAIAVIVGGGLALKIDTPVHRAMLKGQIPSVVYRDTGSRIDNRNVLAIQFWHAHNAWLVTTDAGDYVIRPDCHFPTPGCFAVIHDKPPVRSVNQ